MRRVVRLLTATLLCVALIQPVLAQAEETLQRHTVALENLQASVDQLGSDSSASLDALEGAASTMRLVARDTDSSTLVPALEQAFNNARTAIANQSRADLAVQTAVLRGGFQRALLESALESGSVGSARPGFTQLSQELNLDGEAVQEMTAATTLQALLKHYQAGVARSIAGQLTTVRNLFPDNQADAYVTLADAYGRSLSLQDAPEAPADLNGGFTSLITAVVEADAETVAANAPLLAGQLLATAESLTGAATTDVTAQTPPAGPGEDAAPEPVQVAPEQQPEAAAAEPAQPETPAVAPEQPEAAPLPEVAAETAPEEPAAEASGQAEDAAASQPVPAVDIAAVRAELAAEQEQLAIDSLVNDLGRRGLRGQTGENLARQLHSRGFSSVAEVLGTGLELAGRSAAAASAGDQAAARQHLSQLSSHYQTNLSSLAARMATGQDETIRSLLGALQSSPALSVTDLQALTGQLASLGSSSGAEMQRSVQASAATWTSGWPRLVLLILAAILAIIPLVLLRMAFGNTNRNWSLISSGLLLLLLPLILSGVGALLDVIGRLASVPLLHEIAAWLSVTGSAQQLLSILLFLLAVILLGLGTYGICKQFGLFGGVEGTRRRGRRTDDEGKTETRTLVDWDEEF